jgi:hypothetical protein
VRTADYAVGRDPKTSRSTVTIDCKFFLEFLDPSHSTFFPIPLIILTTLFFGEMFGPIVEELAGLSHLVWFFL